MAEGEGYMSDHLTREEMLEKIAAQEQQIAELNADIARMEKARGSPNLVDGVHVHAYLVTSGATFPSAYPIEKLPHNPEHINSRLAIRRAAQVAVDAALDNWIKERAGVSKAAKPVEHSESFDGGS